MYIIVSTAGNGTAFYYGTWRSSEAARVWGMNFHGTREGWEIVELNRVN
jgi:hypothetical protein